MSRDTVPFDPRPVRTVRPNRPRAGWVELVMARSSKRDEGEDPDLRAEWRQLRRAALFFCACVLLVVVLAVVGIYH